MVTVCPQKAGAANQSIFAATAQNTDFHSLYDEFRKTWNGAWLKHVSYGRYVADARAKTRRSADGIFPRVCDHSIVICPRVGSRVKGRQPKGLVSLPPAILRNHNAGIEGRIKFGSHSRCTVGRPDFHPFTLRNASRGGGRGMNCYLRIGYAFAKRCDMTVLTVAILHALRGSQHQREMFVTLKRRTGWFKESGQRRKTLSSEHLGKQFDLTCLCFEPLGDVLLVFGQARPPNASRIFTQVLKRDS